MELVESNRTNADLEENEDVKFHRTKITAAKEILRLLKVRLQLLDATFKESQHELFNDLPKLEAALSLAIQEMQKVIFKHQLVNIAVQRSTQSALLYVYRKKFFGSANLNDIEQNLSHNLRSMLSQSELLQQNNQISEKNFENIIISRCNLIAVVESIREKLDNDETLVDHEQEKEAVLKKINKINVMRNLLCKMVTKNRAKERDELLPLVWKWRTTRTYSYYENLISNADEDEQ